MKHIKEIASWFVGDIINCDDEYDILELEMLEDMYQSLLELDVNGKENKFKDKQSANIHC